MKTKLEQNPICISAPCRLDFGGTLDISTFYFPLMQHEPSTFNLAINMRTRVSLLPYTSGRVKISSRGFETAEFDSESLPLSHPMGLMFAIATCFGADGVHIDIQSSSPPRSALGGSSVAAVALITAFCTLNRSFDHSDMQVARVALLAHQIESSVARVPCGIQDQLAAAYGGVNRWIWTGNAPGLLWEREILAEKSLYPDLEKHFIAAYCGQPHESKDINGRWVDSFLTGKDPEVWKQIVLLSNQFSKAFSEQDYPLAAGLMEQEMSLRLAMTPDVLDPVGVMLNNAALQNGCGARFTGAGGGGCVWATGSETNIKSLKKIWKDLLKKTKTADLLDIKIDSEGLRKESMN